MDEITTREGITVAALVIMMGLLIAEVLGRGLPTPVMLSVEVLCLALVMGVADD